MKLRSSLGIVLIVLCSMSAWAGAGSSPTLSQDEIRDLIRRTADNDIQNEKKLRDYTYVERQETRKLNGKGEVKSTETETSEVLDIYGEQVQKVIAKND